MKPDDDRLALSEDEELAAAVEVVNRLIADRGLVLAVRPVSRCATGRGGATTQADTEEVADYTLQLLRNIRAAVAMAAQADDAEARLDAVMACKSFLQEAARLGSGVAPPPRRHMAALLRSVLTNTYAEELTEAQLAALRESADVLVSRDITEADVRAASARLRGAGLEVIPSVSEEKRVEVLKSLGINIDD